MKTFEEAQQFLIDFAFNCEQPVEKVNAFVSWQKNASTDDLNRLDEWHKIYLSENKFELSSDAAIVNNNENWISKNIQLEKSQKAYSIFLFKKIAAVFIISITIGFSIWKFSTKKNTKAVSINTSSTEKHIKPGSSKAILTLGDGKRIVLDSNYHEIIPAQNGVQISNKKDNLLAYTGTSTSKVTYNTLTVPKGGQYQLELPDGTHVWLNSDSKLTYPTAFTGNNREVSLSGEAYFEVVHNAVLPFLVHALNVNVKVLGTGFNVKAYENDPSIKTTLIHGSVKVSTGSLENLIVPGQQATLEKGSTIFQISRPNLDEIIAWRKGEFWFNKTSVESIMRQIERWYNVSVDYKGSLNGITLSGVLSKEQNAEDLLDILQSTQQVRFKINGNTITVQPYQKKNIIRQTK